jgi:hypothetical protein
VLVYDAPRRGLERCRQRRRCIRHVIVDETGESIRPVPRNDGLKKEEQLVLAFGEMANRRRQPRDVFSLLSPYDGRGVFSRRRKIRARARASNFDEPFRAATRRTDRPCKCRTFASRLALTATRTDHTSASHTRQLSATCSDMALYWQIRSIPRRFSQSRRNTLCTTSAGATSGIWRNMAEGFVRSQSPVEYFRELVAAAMQHQRVSAQELTSFYVVNLLASFMHLDHSPAAREDEALGVRLVEALAAQGATQRDELRRVGDLSLFMSGFFCDSLNRRLVDVDYYIQLGEHAYASLARRDGPFGDVFDELSGKFVAFVDVLSEVSEHSAMTNNSDLLRLYEKWLRTKSRRSGDLLAARGIVPNAAGSRFVQ